MVFNATFNNISVISCGGKRLKITNKELIKSSNSKNDRQYNNQTKKYKVQTDKKSLKMPKIISLK